MKPFQNFKAFYAFYLKEHQHPTCLRLHFIGTLSVICLFILFLLTQNLFLLFLIPLAGYGFAWIGHFIYEKNKPATFKYPIYSLIADFVLFKDIVTKRIKI